MRLRSVAFTLVEVLTVTVIAFILSAIVTAAFLMVKRKAKSTDCRTNLATIYKAVELYAADYDGLLPPYGFLNQPPAVARRLEFVSTLSGYGATSNVFYCPEDSHAKTPFQGEWHSFFETSYTLGPEVIILDSVNSDGTWRFSLSSIPKPSDFILFCDQTILDRPQDGIQVRRSAHGNRMNLVFGDGHTKEISVWKP